MNLTQDNYYFIIKTLIIPKVNLQKRNFFNIIITTKPNQKIHLNIHLISEKGLCYPKTDESKINENNKLV